MSPNEEPSEPEAALPLGARVRRELKRHPMAYTVLVLFMLGGTVIFPEIFPGTSRAKGALGGMLLGVWGTLAAVGGKFLDD
jgi:hypothetical protein